MVSRKEEQANGKPEPENFEQWISATLGAGIAELFLRPYNEKIWASPLSELSHQWIRDRIAMPPLCDVLRAICLEEDQTSFFPNATFRYPRRGGTGIIWRRTADRLAHNAVRYGRRVVCVDRSAHLVRCSTGESFRYEHLISSAPVGLLASVCRPHQDLADAKRLTHTSTHVVGLGLKGPLPEELRDKYWGYYCQDWLPFYRLTVMSNLSAENTPAPAGYWSLMAEVATSARSPMNSAKVVDAVIRGIGKIGLLRDAPEIASTWHRRLEHGYPVPTRDRDVILATVLAHLERDEIYSRGRFGAWKYEVSFQDHSFMQGVEVVDRILFGRPEPTLNNPDRVNHA